jgi:hypothetical protein
MFAQFGGEGAGQSGDGMLAGGVVRHQRLPAPAADLIKVIEPPRPPPR